MDNIVNGFEIPKFTPLYRYVLIPALNNIFSNIEPEDSLEGSLVESQQEASQQDYKTVVLAKGESVSDKIEVGDTIQIVPDGSSNFIIPLEIDGIEYFLIRDNTIVGIYK